MPGRIVVSGAKGKQGRVFIGDAQETELCVTSWEVTETAEEEDVTNSCSGGESEFELGSIVTEYTLDALWDIDQSPMADPPNLRSGQSIHLRLFVHSSPAGDPTEPDGPFYDFDARVTTTRLGVPAKGLVTYNITGKASDPNILRPTADVSSSG